MQSIVFAINQLLQRKEKAALSLSIVLLVVDLFLQLLPVLRTGGNHIQKLPRFVVFRQKKSQYGKHSNLKAIVDRLHERRSFLTLSTNRKAWNLHWHTVIGLLRIDNALFEQMSVMFGLVGHVETYGLHINLGKTILKIVLPQSLKNNCYE